MFPDLVFFLPVEVVGILLNFLHNELKLCLKVVVRGSDLSCNGLLDLLQFALTQIFIQTAKEVINKIFNLQTDIVGIPCRGDQNKLQTQNSPIIENLHPQIIGHLFEGS